MIYMCGECGYEFEGSEFVHKCPTCGADEESFIIQPFNVMSDLQAFDNVNE